MRRLSSSLTVFHKILFPVVWFGATGLLTVVFAIQGEAAALIPLGMGLFGLVLMARLIFPLADEVWLDGDDVLIVHKGRQEDRFPLRNVVNVESSYFLNPDRITLTLREPCVFGGKIFFLPPVRIFRLPFSQHPLADELNDLIRRATYPDLHDSGRP